MAVIHCERRRRRQRRGGGGGRCAPRARREFVLWPRSPINWPLTPTKQNIYRPLARYANPNVNCAGTLSFDSDLYRANSAPFRRKNISITAYFGYRFACGSIGIGCILIPLNRKESLCQISSGYCKLYLPLFGMIF